MKITEEKDPDIVSSTFGDISVGRVFLYKGEIDEDYALFVKATDTTALWFDDDEWLEPSDFTPDEGPCICVEITEIKYKRIEE